MTALLAALALLLISSLLALISGSSRWATRVGVGGVIGASILGLAAAIPALFHGDAPTLRTVWAVPYGELFLSIDRLSAFFLLPVFSLPALAAIYGAEALETSPARRAAGAVWCFFNLLIGSLAVVVTARNGMLFLVAWEVMTLASFFLLTLEHERQEVREAGWGYLVAGHLGAACLMAMFVLLAQQTGSMGFDAAVSLAPAAAGGLFLLGLLGFGTKAGLAPMHVWLPDAYQSAPPFVAVVLTGVMSKLGIYGILRILLLLDGPPPAWWGWLLIGLGLTSGLTGIVLAVAQLDLRRLLAYSSVENLGIITLGIGCAVLGWSVGSTPLVALGFAGGLMHVINHGLFKGLLFMATGAIGKATGTTGLETLGGLLKRMPGTGRLFLLGSAAIAGLPVLNGFVSELLIYSAALRGIQTLERAVAAPLIPVVAGLALVGGLAAAAFAKAFGVAFLGEPRSERAVYAEDPGWRMQLPMAVLAIGCVLLGLVPMRWVVDGARLVMPVAMPVGAAGWEPLSVTRSGITFASLAVLVLVGLLAALRRSLLAGRDVGEAGTWDCGYARPTARMQYTGSSFSQPLTRLFGPLLRIRESIQMPSGLFPGQASLTTESPDPVREALFRRSFTLVGRSLSRLRWLQNGRVHLYILYIAVTLVVLLVWGVG